mgnify:CR=1 FL=1
MKFFSEQHILLFFLFDYADQVQMLNDAIEKKPDGIALAACDTNSVIDSLTKALEAGIVQCLICCNNAFSRYLIRTEDRDRVVLGHDLSIRHADGRLLV